MKMTLPEGIDKPTAIRSLVMGKGPNGKDAQQEKIER